MSEIVVSEGKVPSELLSGLIKSAADNFVDFTTAWQEICDRGKLEGFSEQELKALIVPQIKDQLRRIGMTENQINGRLYYKFNSDKVKERVYGNRKNEKMNIHGIDDKNDIEESSSWDKESLLEELGDVRTQLQNANETIESMSMEENPDIFRINKADPNSMVFTRMKGSDAIGLIRNDLKTEKFYDIAWKEVM